MCDYGRLDYRWMNRGDRIEAPLVRQAERHVAVDWDTALDTLGRLASGAGSVVILASGRASVESLGLVRRLAGAGPVTAAIRVPIGDEAPLAGIPDLALRKERVPNLHGAAMLGYGPEWGAALRAAAGAGLVILLDVALSEEEERTLAGAAGRIVVLGTAVSGIDRRADLVLPVTSMAEENGVYVNRDYRAQRYHQAKPAPGMARPAWWIAGEVLAGQGPDRDAPSTASEAFDLVAAAFDAFAGLRHADLGFSGRRVAAPAGASR
jgi:predicted molibdopterin-dependent oxidoreductase YjgC